MLALDDLCRQLKDTILEAISNNTLSVFQVGVLIEEPFPMLALDDLAGSSKTPSWKPLRWRYLFTYG
ncbi:hypothetical protein KSP39_PZI016698 [Platanthera zijinensis]|uniref:Uncharacterized protein n=1 Tax=Platanthera zijinensis TaxID=2320716 RepID=A0AAP0B7R3_9ASPA